MALPVTPVGDNPYVPGVVASAYFPDQLIAGQNNLVTASVVLGAGTLKRGTVLGLQTPYATTTAAKAGGNTGNGGVNNVTFGVSPEEGGPYVLTATSATTFTVVDPEGVALANATVGTPYTSAEINFTISAGGTAFAAGDAFNLTVVGRGGQYIACVKTASDGSQTPLAILVDDADASAGPVRCGVYVAGEFNVRAIIADSSWNATTLTLALRPVGIFLKASVSAADPT